ncbi:MAG: hypothetical protein K2W94_08330 [Alphaproteobacteria bacterium]|nr:hypothetical protein [Alphaproteobacteria bacterium]
MPVFLKILSSVLLLMLYTENISVMALHSNSIYYNQHHRKSEFTFKKPTPVESEHRASSGMVEKIEQLKAAVKKIQETPDESALDDQIKLLEICKIKLSIIDHTAEVSNEEFEELKSKGLDKFREDVDNLENQLFIIRPVKDSRSYIKPPHPEGIAPKKLLTLIHEGNGQFHYKRAPDPNKKEKPQSQTRCWQVLNYEKNKEEIEQLVDRGRMSAYETMFPVASSIEKTKKLKDAHTTEGNALQGYSTNIYKYEFKYTDEQKAPLIIQIYQIKKEKCNIPLPADSKG